MRCLLCHTLIPEEDDTCPKCGDNVGRWRRLDQYASQLARDGSKYLNNGDLPRAALALAKSSVLDPANPQTLLDLGVTLNRQRLFAEAAYYLERAEQLADQDALPILEDIRLSLDEARSGIG